ncbi:MAG: hypothetical protein JO353_08970 [Phycisphaerae bacterium]|nr:hypothetical protein [Phycisphaerae bacterium]
MSESYDFEPFAASLGATGIIQLPEPADVSSAWSIPLLCIGIAIIACCVLVPAANENRDLLLENAHLQADLTQINKQIAINEQFLKSVADNPTLLERLAERQMKLVRNGESVLKVQGEAAPQAQMSPFLLLNLPPPQMAPELAPPRHAWISTIAQQPRIRLFAMGGALLLMATSLVLGAAPRRADD